MGKSLKQFTRSVGMELVDQQISEKEAEKQVQKSVKTGISLDNENDEDVIHKNSRLDEQKELRCRQSGESHQNEFHHICIIFFS